MIYLCPPHEPEPSSKLIRRFHTDRLPEPCLQLQHPYAPLGWQVDLPPTSRSWHTRDLGGLSSGMVARPIGPTWIPHSTLTLVVPDPGTFCMLISHRFDGVGKREKSIFGIFMFFVENWCFSFFWMPEAPIENPYIPIRC